MAFVIDVAVIAWLLPCILMSADAQQVVPIKSIMGNVVVNTPYGWVKGVTYTSQYENLPNRWVNAYLGVPYAKTLEQYGSEWREKYRFHNADDDPFWYGTYDATKHKPACPQMPWLVKETVWGFSDVSEDCLYLDVYAPNISTETPSVSPNLYPVLVFLHGGGFIMGASKQWPGVFLAERFVVVVVINYRLNALGFLSTGDRYSPGNYGMFDQVKALKFIKKTIRSFRGNPDKITLMGQSAGAASVGMHLVSPRSVDLFNQAIMLSGSEMSEWAVIKTADSVEYARRLCREVGCPTSDSQQMMDCLRYYRSFEQIVNASAKVAMLPGKIGNPWAPVVDGPFVGVNYAFLPDPPADLRRQLRQLRVPLLAGMVLNEGAYFIPNFPNLIDGVTQVQFRNILNEFIRYRDISDVNALYDALEFQYTYWPQPTNYSWTRYRLMEMMGDYMFGAAISATLRSHVLTSTVFSYVFEYNSWNNYNPQWRGISHGQDLDYIFGFPFINDTYRDLLGIFPRQEYDYSDRNISEFMITMITNFTSSGEPTPRTEQFRFFRNTSWWHYNLENHTYLSINNISKNKENYRQNEFHFWNDYYPKLAGYSQYYYKQPVETGPSSASTYEITTWALTAVGGVLLLVVIGLIVMLICQSRTKKYPKYNNDKSSEKFDNDISILSEKIDNHINSQKIDNRFSSARYNRDTSDDNAVSSGRYNRDASNDNPVSSGRYNRDASNDNPVSTGRYNQDTLNNSPVSTGRNNRAASIDNLVSAERYNRSASNVNPAFSGRYNRDASRENPISTRRHNRDNAYVNPVATGRYDRDESPRGSIEKINKSHSTDV